MFESAEFRRKPKGSTLKPLELDTTVRAPASYVRTRVYADQLAEEGSHILLEYLGTQARSIAFPEMVVPTTVQLKRGLKTCTSPKLSAALKHLLDKVAQNSAWIEKRREGVEFAPKDRSQVDRFLENEKAEAPLEAAVRLARKVREQKRKAVETVSVIGDKRKKSLCQRLFQDPQQS